MALYASHALIPRGRRPSARREVFRIRSRVNAVIRIDSIWLATEPMDKQITHHKSVTELLPRRWAPV